MRRKRYVRVKFAHYLSKIAVKHQRKPQPCSIVLRTVDDICGRTIAYAALFDKPLSLLNSRSLVVQVYEKLLLGTGHSDVQKPHLLLNYLLATVGGKQVMLESFVAADVFVVVQAHTHTSPLAEHDMLRGHVERCPCFADKYKRVLQSLGLVDSFHDDVIALCGSYLALVEVTYFKYAVDVPDKSA